MIEYVIIILIMVESGGNPNTPGDGGNAIGVLQITPIMVDDVNRIAGYPVFSYNDRYDVEASKEMARIYFTHYGQGKTRQQLYRLWSGGPDGDRQECTLDDLRKCLEMESYNPPPYRSGD